PEIDVPGHARAAIKAMEARHARLTAQGQEEEAAAFLLNDPDDLSEYRSVQMWDDNVIDVCLPSTYRFLKAVVDDLVAMYAEAGAPLTTIHTGGDEVPHGVWEQSPACERLIEENTAVDEADDLPGYFLREISSILAEHGLVTAGWEEIALKEEGSVKAPNAAFLDSHFQPYVWNNVWGWGAEDMVYRLANAGYEVVMCNVTNLYFDLAYDKDPQEPGYYWGGFVDTRKPYELAPFDLYKSAWETTMGNAIDPDLFQHHTRPTEAGKQNILGIQGQLWAENAKGPVMMEYLAFPKLLGLAERAWASQPDWAQIEDAAERRQQLDAAWSRFANSLGHRDLPRLDHLFGGVNYRLPPPGAVIEDGLLNATVAFPGLTIRYTTDGSEPTASSTLYEGPVAASGTIRLKTFDTRGRSSRTAVVAE
ncbi:MAG: family 20 glycosylhydrolase, partial [Bacteroidetes bacterium]|nr:family 20 glycosylhydrolase [Bacteroidota bacterium]